MKKTLLAFLLIFIFSFSLEASENFSEMSTQELISIMGYVKKGELKKFTQELESRVKSMSEKEKKAYQKNLEKNK
ncbi:MAG: DUF1104 domain-containing protein [Helicobacteraceae bacterium]|nr:DUF1104 domain-containing protein [Candidatus Sulfurimonas ponti]